MSPILGINKYLNSKWTSTENIQGWRHFQVCSIFKNKQQLELFAIFNKKIFIIINLEEIKNKKKWIYGWKSWIYCWKSWI